MWLGLALYQFFSMQLSALKLLYGSFIFWKIVFGLILLRHHHHSHPLHQWNPRSIHWIFSFKKMNYMAGVTFVQLLHEYGPLFTWPHLCMATHLPLISSLSSSSTFFTQKKLHVKMYLILFLSHVYMYRFKKSYLRDKIVATSMKSGRKV